MYAQVKKPKENKSRAVVNSVVQNKNKEKQDVRFEDNRPESKILKSLQMKIQDKRRITQHCTNRIIQRECTHPTGITISNAVAIDTDPKVGMSVINTTVPGDVSDGVKISERIDGVAKSGSFSGVSLIPHNSGWRDGSSSPSDRHQMGPKSTLINVADDAGNGTVTKSQMFLWKHEDAECGNDIAVAVGKSGYEITKTLTKGPGNKVSFFVKKDPSDVSSGGLSTTAGESAALSKTIVLREE